MVFLTWSKEPRCSMAATVHPPTSSTGAAADESTPHHGTSRTGTTIGETTHGPPPNGRTTHCGSPHTRPAAELRWQTGDRRPRSG